MKRKYRILKLSTFAYIPQIQHAADKRIWRGLCKAGFTWDNEEHQMKYSRTYTLFGAKALIREHIKENNKTKNLTNSFKNAQVVYEIEVDE
jgi:hypothetical protein